MSETQSEQPPHIVRLSDGGTVEFPAPAPAVTAKPDREHRIAMGEGYSAAYVEARKHMWPEAHIRHAVSKAYRDGYMQAHIDRDAESAEAIRPAEQFTEKDKNGQ